jgi:hypothetical protein
MHKEILKIYTNICSKIKAKLIAKTGKLIAKINWAELTVNSLKYWRLPKILMYTQNIRFQSKCMRTPQNICAYQNLHFQSKYMRTS